MRAMERSGVPVPHCIDLCLDERFVDNIVNTHLRPAISSPSTPHLNKFFCNEVQQIFEFLI